MMDEIKVGDTVHYVSHGTPLKPDGTQAYASRCRAAIVTEAVQSEGLLGLAVLNPTGLFFDQAVSEGDHIREPGTWHWPNH